MNFTQLSTFRTLMLSESMSDAANKLGRTQPAVSATIKALEEQIGLQLFERRGRQLIPAPEAQYLFTEAEEILSQMTRVRQTMQSLSAGQAGKLNVAAMPGPVSLVFPAFITSQLAGKDEISVSIQARTSNQIAELARAQSIDFGFADAPDGDNPETLYHAEIISADCLIAVPETHRLAYLSSIGIEDLNDEPVGTLLPSHAQSAAIRAAFIRENCRFRQTVESQSFLPLLHFVAAAQCCAILDPLSVFMAQGKEPMVRGIRIKPMRSPIRYNYAIYSPLYRPISVIARDMRAAWRAKVMSLLTEVNANPELSSLYDI